MSYINKSMVLFEIKLFAYEKRKAFLMLAKYGYIKS